MIFVLIAGSKINEVFSMKMFLISTLYNVGGAGGVAALIAEEIQKMGNSVVFAETREESGTGEKKVNGVRGYEVGLRNVYWPYLKDQNHSSVSKAFWHALNVYNPWMGAEIGRLLEREQPDLLHTQNLSGFTVSAWHAARKRNIPIVHTCQDYSLLCPRSMYRDDASGTRNCYTQCWKCCLFSQPRRPFTDMVDAVIGVSKFVIGRHLDLGYFSDVETNRVIYNPHDYNEVDIADTSASPNGPLHIGFLGRLTPLKGIEFLADSLVEDELSNWTLHVAGRGEKGYERKLKNKYESKKVELMGFIDPYELLSNIDVLVVPSLWNEPFGLVVVEAMSFGVPVVASNRGAFPEIIDTGKTGFIFEISDKKDMIDKIVKAKEKMTYKSKKKEIKKISKHFHVSKTAEEYLNTFEKVL